MNFSIFLLAPIVFTTAATAMDVCANIDSMRISDKSMMLSISGKKATLNLIHSASDFAISKSGKWTVAYGGYFPKTKEATDQTFTAVSIFGSRNLRKPKKIIILSQGVYEVLFDNREENIYITARYGLIEINGSTLKNREIGIDFPQMETNKYSGGCEAIHLKYPKYKSEKSV